MKLADWLKSKTFWSAVGLVGLAVYQFTQGHADQGLQSLFAAGAAIGIRHSVAKVSP